MRRKKQSPARSAIGAGSHSALKDVVSIGSAKEAALYFERVFPFDFAQSLMDHVNGVPIHDPGAVPFEDGRWDEAVLHSMLPDITDPVRLYLEYALLALAFRSVHSCLDRPENAEIFLNNPKFPLVAKYFEMSGFNAKEIMESLKDQTFDLQRFQYQLGEKTLKIMKASRFEQASMMSSNRLDIDPEPNENTEPGIRFMVALRNLRLVDPDKVSWNQLVEFRKDDDSRAALRDLRLFFADEFSGKEPDYITDKLSALLDRQERVARLWGFDTIRKTFAVAISQESVLASSIGSLATAALGAPLPVAAAAAASVSLGSCALEFGRVYVESQMERIDRPTRYLSHLRKKLG